MKFIKAIIRAFRAQKMREEYGFLSQSVDHADLECRMKRCEEARFGA